MPFSIRHFRRFPIHCFAQYDAGPFTGVGTVSNLSMNGCRLSGDLPLRVGEPCSFTAHLPNGERVFVAEAIVRWARLNEYGVETIGLARPEKTRLERYVKRLIEEQTAQ